MKMPEIDYAALELREIGTWPFVLRVAIIAASGILAILAIYFVIIESHMTVLNLQEEQLVTKRNEFKEKYNMAVNLDAYKQQMIEMQGMYKEYLKALPSASDIPDLIDGISRLGERNSLKFGSIKIGDAKVASGFYMELPIDLIITGTYNNIGSFISDLSKLPRIVTIEDFSIKPIADDQSNKNPGLLLMNLAIKTYWVASQSEQQSAAGKVNKTSVPPPPAKSSSPADSEPLAPLKGMPGAPPLPAPKSGGA